MEALLQICIPFSGYPYHLPRALYTCNALGVEAIGVPAADRISRDGGPIDGYLHLRELPATLAALWELHLSHPIPVLGSPEPIFGAAR
jgi:vancomycin permeability regulator SanA